jgi:hypothetical protein
MKYIVGAVITAAVLAVAFIGYPMLIAKAQPAYTTVTGSSVTANPTEKVYFFSVTTNGNIPNVPDDYINSKLVFGYAWLDENTSPVSAVVVTIHPGIKDSTQNPNLWHPHTAQLQPTADCNGVGLGLQVVGLASPTAGVSINGNNLTLRIKADSATVNPNTFDAATAFTIELGNNNALCVAPP